MNTTETRTHSHHDHHARRGWWPFTRHFLEMIAAMLVGMAVLGGARMGVLALLDTEIPGGASTGALLMAFDMSVGMVAWMRFRGHRWAPCLEMTAAMFVPVLAALALLWTGVIDEGGLMLIEHAGMVPAMLLAMLIRPSEYGR